MGYFSISALINLVTSLILGIFVLVKNRKEKVNKRFFIFCFSVASWSFGYYFWQVSKNSTDALFWSRLLMVGAIFIPITYLHFVLELTGFIKEKRWSLFIGYPLFLIFLLFNFTNLFITHVEPIMGFKFWPMAGIAYGPFLAIWYFYVVYSTYLLYRKYRQSEGIARLQVKYVLLGMIFAFAAGSTNYFLWYRIPIPPVLNIFVTAYVATVTYAIIRYRFMDIRIVARKIFLYFGATIFVYGIFYLILWLDNNFLGGSYSRDAYLVGIIFAVGFVVLFQLFNNLIIKFANRYLFFSLYNYQETINKLSQELTHYTDLNKIIDTIVDTIKKTMQLDRAGVLLSSGDAKITHFQISKVVGFNKQNGISLVQDNFLTKYLEKTQKLLVADELGLLSQDAKTKENKEGFAKMKDYMNHIEASLCLPLISGKKLIGIIVLGSKISGDAYSKEDLELLSILSRQAATAIDNARLYKETQEFSKTLQNKVDEQTKEIKQKSQYLQELLNMKNDFLRVVNHQLNTPISIVKGAFSLMKEGDWDTDRALVSIDNGFQRISQTVSDFWDAYELEGEKMKMNLEKTDIMAIVEKLIPEKKKIKLAQDRKLGISVKKPSFTVPPVWCDAQKITHVISNLLDNAVYYTEKGKIAVSFERTGKSHLKINVSDTGVGITETNKSRLFQKFSRGEGASSLHPDGSGLGLYIAKKIMEGNDGELAYSSEGLGRGSVFSFTVPIYQNQKNDDKSSKQMAEKNKIIIFNKNN